MTFVDNGAPVGYNSDRIIWRKSGNAVPGRNFPGSGTVFRRKSGKRIWNKPAAKNTDKKTSGETAKPAANDGNIPGRDGNPRRETTEISRRKRKFRREQQDIPTKPNKA